MIAVVLQYQLGESRQARWSGGEGWLAQLGTLPHLTVYKEVTVSVSSDPVAVYMYLVSGSCDWC